MNETLNNGQNSESEIDLKALFMALWKQKKIIIVITLIFTILAGMYSFLLLDPVYDTKLNLVISMPETFTTKYVEYSAAGALNVAYSLPITSNEQYLNLFTSNNVLVNSIKEMGYIDGKVTLEKLKKRIAISKSNAPIGVVQNSFDVNISAGSPQESLKLANTMYNNYIEFMDVMINERAVNYFYNYFDDKVKSSESELASNKVILEKNVALLAQTPQTINQNAAMNEIQGKLTDTSNFVVLENIINPNYTRVEGDIILNRQVINSIENRINAYKGYLQELDTEKKAIAKYYETGKAIKVDTSVVSVIKSSIYMPSPAVAPSQKTSPKNTQNVAIGLILGMMLGVIAAYIKEYWFSKS